MDQVVGHDTLYCSGLSEEGLVAVRKRLHELLLKIEVSTLRRRDSFFVQAPRPLDLRFESLQEIAALASRPHRAFVIQLDLRHEEARVASCSLCLIVGCAAAVLRSAADQP